MKFFTHSIRIGAPAEKLTQAPPKAPENFKTLIKAPDSTQPVSQPQQVSPSPNVSQPPALPGPVHNQHNNPRINPFYDLEEPSTHQYGVTPPSSTKPTGNGMLGSKFHRDSNGTAYGVAKHDANSALTEPLVHQIDKHLGFNVVPETVTRGYQLEPHSQWDEHAGAPDRPIYPHSVQRTVPGSTIYDSQGLNKYRHNDYGKIAWLDYLTGNHDRHDSNAMYDDEEDKIHAIDNGGAFDYRDEGDRERIGRNLSFLRGDIPDDFRNGILNANDNHLKNLFQRADASPYSITNPDYIPYDKKYKDDSWVGHPQNGFLAGNFAPGSPMEAHKHFSNRLNRLRDVMKYSQPLTWEDLHNEMSHTQPNGDFNKEPEEEE